MRRPRRGPAGARHAPAIEIVGTAVEPARAAQKLAAANAQVVLRLEPHGPVPVEDVEAIRQATSAPIVLVTASSATGLLQEALSHGSPTSCCCRS